MKKNPTATNILIPPIPIPTIIPASVPLGKFPFPGGAGGGGGDWNSSVNGGDGGDRVGDVASEVDGGGGGGGSRAVELVVGEVSGEDIVGEILRRD